MVIVGSPNVNPGYKLVGNTQYPQIAQDYERTFKVLKSLPCDVFLGAHGDYYGMAAKFARMKPGGANPFIDGEGYKSYVAEREQRIPGGTPETVGKTVVLFGLSRVPRPSSAWADPWSWGRPGELYIT